ncbi:HAD family phosphatase [Herbiconiux moechotypicola]|uniref:HAD family hydrolase n=1 Tax=Herbiconiux moechotypicola TaxID=637393 RepID=UPI00217CC9D0|nr:HAD family phosphatase [Herbiconiux moechotypicola]MCS5731292.1 HAD family phosphatase [Herbiconiux moechotypicola]
MTALLPAAVLWDMDGTIVDTEPYWMLAQERLVESFGGTWTHEAAMTLVGSGLDRSAAILQEFGVRMESDAIIQLLSSEVMEQISHQVPWRPGALELLTAVHESGIPQALVTMSIGRMAHHVADYIPFPAFATVVSADVVTEMKPHPEAYLTAASLLGVDVTRSVAIEDSVTGVTSAVASGAVVIGVQHLLNLDDSGADRIWTTLDGRGLDDLAAVLADARSARTAGGRVADERAAS